MLLGLNTVDLPGSSSPIAPVVAIEITNDMAVFKEHAEVWFEGLPVHEKQYWDAFKVAGQRRFPPMSAKLKMMIMSIKKLATESMGAFISKFKAYDFKLGMRLMIR
ncbi:hypothetical protein R1flu_010527 [Riccia fluitans]|uniref:Uncharacterized protein n=1 Tax=Riccia fluitans TaxID=41844 RepID=A0ABD1Z5E4_9MARC